jgi:hypothetical protein
MINESKNINKHSYWFEKQNSVLIKNTDMNYLDIGT